MFLFKLAKSIISIVVILAFAGCTSSPNEYEVDIQNWHQSRINYLKSEEGFLNLAGLYWLKEGVNTFGSDSLSNLDFTAKSLPNMGAFLLQDSLVYLVTKNDILVEDKIVSDTTLVFNNGAAKNMKFGSLQWYIVKRGEQIGVRLRDFEHELLDEFDSIDYFNTDVSWKIKAVWKPYDNPVDIPFANVLGMTIIYPVNGAFYFTIEGNEYKLEPLGEPDKYGYFVMFYDKTSGKSTYGSGRYIYIPEPDLDGLTSIDFNKAFNPPCAFTEFATCLFPHKENRLLIFVNAGEKFSGH